MSKSDKSLDEQVDNMLIWDINGRKEPVIFKDEIKTAIKCLIQDNYISKAEHEKALVELIEKSLIATNWSTMASVASAKYMNIDAVNEAKSQAEQAFAEQKKALEHAKGLIDERE